MFSVHQICQQCGMSPTSQRRGIVLCSPCMTNWILHDVAPVIKEDRLPELEAAQNLLEGAKYEETERKTNEDA